MTRQEASLQGFFISFEGLDRTGKTTQISELSEYLLANGVDSVVTREPGGSQLGRTLREVLLSSGSPPVNMKAEALLYAADRAQHVADVILPALQRGAVVLSDRFVDSSLVYQGFAGGLEVDWVERINVWATDGLVPDLTIMLDMGPEESLARLRGQRDRIEMRNVQYMEQVRRGYLTLAQRAPERILVLSADQEKDALQAKIRQAVWPHVAKFQAGGGATDEVGDRHHTR